ncbi:MAG TPA: hypothetical protein V6D29_23680 [Leptolyngbyaceae cyanobacterium]
MSNSSASPFGQQGTSIAVHTGDPYMLRPTVESLTLEPALLAQLRHFQIEQGLPSLTCALQAVLHDYFGTPGAASGPDNAASPALRTLVNELQADQKQLFRTVTSLQQTLSVLLLQMQSAATTPTRPIQPRPATACADGTLKPAVYEKGLSGTDLAARLKTSSATISKRRSRADFPAWSQMKDPEHVAWKYFGSTGRFHPVTLALSTSTGTNSSC